MHTLSAIIEAQADEWFYDSDLDSEREHVATVVSYMMSKTLTKHFYKTPDELLLRLLQRARLCYEQQNALSYQYQWFVGDALKMFYASNDEVAAWYVTHQVPEIGRS